MHGISLNIHRVQHIICHKSYVVVIKYPVGHCNSLITHLVTPFKYL